jgi:hypothetical protein
MDYAAEHKRAEENARQMGNATEDIEVGEGETVSEVSITRKEKEREEQLIEAGIDTLGQFMGLMVDIAQSLDEIRMSSENA